MRSCDILKLNFNFYIIIISSIKLENFKYIENAKDFFLKNIVSELRYVDKGCFFNQIPAYEKNPIGQTFP